MTDDLRTLLGGPVGGDAEPPGLDGLWAAGRSGRAKARLVRAALAAAVVVALVGGSVAVAHRGGDGAVDVASGPSTTAAREALDTSPAICRQVAVDRADVPGSVAALVHGAPQGSGGSRAPALVARVRVVAASWDRIPGSEEGAGLVQHEVEVEVTDPITGVERGTRLAVVDAYGAPGREAYPAVQQLLATIQDQIDEIDAPLAAIDQQLVDLPSDDPRYVALISERERLRSGSEVVRDLTQQRLAAAVDLLQGLQLARRGVDQRGGPACPALRPGRDAIVALGPDRSPDARVPWNLFGALRADGDRLDARQLAALATLVGDRGLLRTARTSTIDELVAALHAAA